jgi:hypothetical protein
MRHRNPSLCRSVLVALALSLFIPVARSESHNPSDYPLRIHIYRIDRHTRYYRGMVEWVDGEGRANLFENGDPKGIDFAYTCGNRFTNSSGFETYPAKWKKPGRSLVLLYHQIGSTSMDTCELKVDVKDFAYVSHNGVLSTEPTNVFKDWMIKQQYDPEHGKDRPAFTQRQQSSPPPPPSAPEPGVQ